MNKKILYLGFVFTLVSCSSSKLVFTEMYAPEESGLNLVKVTDDTSSSILAGSTYRPAKYVKNTGIFGFGAIAYYADYTRQAVGYSKLGNLAWNVNRLLAISPDGRKLAYATDLNESSNIMVRNANSQGVATQRTFRNVHSFSWGDDGNLYFSDTNGSNRYICSISAEAGSMMSQLTNGNVMDMDPVSSGDGKKVFFTRLTDQGPAIWSLDRETGTLTLCARGFSPCLIKNDPDSFYCVRNSTDGRSEIWHVNYVKGQESLVVSDQKRSFTNPCLSPDGKWLLCVGNSVSSISEEENLDVFVIRTDGTRLTQLTYHPATDTCPVWAMDGRSIYFISSRANKDQRYNVWRMNFDLE